jgi:hypothetical protein
MTHLEKLQAALPQLEGKIKSITGGNFKLSASEHTDRMGVQFLKITSEDVAAQLCGVAAPIFKKINLETWGGGYYAEFEIVHFQPKIQYQHWGGGSNGTDYIWSKLFFDIASGEWDFDGSCLIYGKGEDVKKTMKTDLSVELKHYIETKSKELKFADFIIFYDLEDCEKIKLLLTGLTLAQVKNFEGLVNQWCIDKSDAQKTFRELHEWGFSYGYETRFVEDELEFRIRVFDC